MYVCMYGLISDGRSSVVFTRLAILICMDGWMDRLVSDGRSSVVLTRLAILIYMDVCMDRWWMNGCVYVYMYVMYVPVVLCFLLSWSILLNDLALS